MAINKHILSVIFLALLTIQNSSQSLLSRYSKGILKETYNGGTVVLMNEIFKCVISIVGTFITRGKETNIVLHLKTLVMTSLVSSVPALIYFFQNCLYILSLSNIPAELYSVVSQLKILSAAVLSVLIIKKKLTWTQWRALITLIISVVIVEGASRSTMQNNTDFTLFNYIIGVACCVLACTASGFSGVYMEMILKNKVGTGPALNLWERNFQLSLYSIVFAIINIVVFDGSNVISQGLFHGFTPLAWLCVLIMSVGGILVALVMTYADVIVKGFSVSVAIICTTLGSWIFFGTPITLEFVLGAVGVLISISNYNDRTASYAFQNPTVSAEQTTTEEPKNEVEMGKFEVKANENETETQIELIPLEDMEDPSMGNADTDATVILDDIEN